MEEKGYDNDHAGTDSDNDDDSSSTDSSTTITTRSSQPNNTATSSTTKQIQFQDNRPTEIVTGGDDDDTSSSDSSTTDEDATTNATSVDRNTNIPTDRSAVESRAPTSHHQITAEGVVLRQSPATNDKASKAKTEAARLSARLGHMSIVDSVVVRKKVRDRLSQSELYNEIGKLVTDSTDEVGVEQEEAAEDKTDNDAPQPTTHQQSEDDNDSGKSTASDDTSSRSGSVSKSTKEDGAETVTTARVKVNQKISSHVTNDMDDIELDNVVESRDETPTDDSRRGVFSTCCCFRATKES